MSTARLLFVPCPALPLTSHPSRATFTSSPARRPRHTRAFICARVAPTGTRARLVLATAAATAQAPGFAAAAAAAAVAFAVAALAWRRRLRAAFRLLRRWTEDRAWIFRRGEQVVGSAGVAGGVQKVPVEAVVGNGLGKEEEVEVGERLVNRMDAMAERAKAQLDGERLAYGDGAGMDAEEYAKLSATQRRELLAMSFARSFSSAGVPREELYVRGRTATMATGESMRNPSEVQGVIYAPGSVSGWGGSGGNGEGEKKEKGVVARVRDGYWKVAESVNGRAAALGFVLCLAREVLEPGHPTLFDQVEDVLIPIAAHAPPFLVAMCDKIVDLVL